MDIDLLTSDERDILDEQGFSGILMVFSIAPRSQQAAATTLKLMSRLTRHAPVCLGSGPPASDRSATGIPECVSM
jgi:hypothetical protein